MSLIVFTQDEEGGPSPCTSVLDKSCLDVCPVDAIAVVDESDPDEASDPILEILVGPQAFIVQDQCIDCGACFSACPASAIFLSDMPPAWVVDQEVKNMMEDINQEMGNYLKSEGH